MYAYITKGITVGHLLARRVLRTITSIPGMILDSFLALFWVPNYSSYWEDNDCCFYEDNTPGGPVQIVLGWVGEALGFFIGPPIGIVIAIAVFIVDSILWLIRSGQTYLYSTLRSVAESIGDLSFFKHFSVYRSPGTYFQRAWNLGSAAIGSLLVAIPLALAKFVEFIIPSLGHAASSFITKILSCSGAVIFNVVALPLFPIIYLIDKLGELYEIIRATFRNLIAIIYAKTGEQPTRYDYESWCLPPTAMHSPEFLVDVYNARRTSWSTLLFGPLRPADNDDDEDVPNGTPLDAITHDPLGIRGLPTVNGPCGHSFNDYGSQAGIRFWLTNHNTCPIGREPLSAYQLRPNIALNDLLRVHYNP